MITSACEGNAQSNVETTLQSQSVKDNLKTDDKQTLKPNVKGLVFLYSCKVHLK